MLYFRLILGHLNGNFQRYFLTKFRYSFSIFIIVIIHRGHCSPLDFVLIRLLCYLYELRKSALSNIPKSVTFSFLGREIFSEHFVFRHM
jgi:hypothetical protein